MIKYLAVALGLLMLGGCGGPPNPSYKQKEEAKAIAIQPSPRIVVSRISVIEDDLAYNEKRGVYLIIDTKTGTEYIGISGVGVVDVGSHSEGKFQRQDER